MSEIITTLHPENDETVDLYPNIKKENIPNHSIDRDKLSEYINDLLNNIGVLQPAGATLSTNILAFTYNRGIYIGTDTNQWYYWDGTQYLAGGSYIVNDVYTEISSGDLNSYTTINKYKIRGVNLVTLLNIPSGLVSSVGAVLINERSSYADGYIKQTLIQSPNKIFYRFYNYNTWTDWERITNTSELDSTLNNTIYKRTNATILEANTDLNTLKDYKSYVSNSNNTNTLLNVPNFITSGAGCCIINERSTYASANDYLKQTFIYGNGLIAYRFLIADSWTEWHYPANKEDITGIPDYWDNEINDTISKVATNTLGMETHTDCFAFVTDEHWGNNAKHSPSIIDYLSKNIGFSLLLNGGDIITGAHSNKINAIKEINSFFEKFNNVNIISTFGNHDFNPSTGNYLDSEELYNVISKRSEKFTDTKGSYKYYYDNVSQKIRYVTIPTHDNYSFSNDTKTFLNNVCSELSSDWTIVILTHIYWTPTTTGEPTISTYASTDMVFIADLKESINATIACVLVGHVHRDYDALVTSTSENTELLVIGFQEDAYATSSLWQGATMTLGTDTEQAISIIQIDMNNNKIYITRCGAGNDREFDY